MLGVKTPLGSWRFRLAAAAVAAAALAEARAANTMESPEVARLYGSGVHAYFSGDFDRTYADMTAAIETGSLDPRSHYFRGLAALRLGRLDEAEADFSQGALLEADPAGAWSVSRSLERVQGHDRMQLERHRVRARVADLQRRRAMERARYDDTQAAQPGVQRTKVPADPSGGAAAGAPFVEKPSPPALPANPPAAPAPATPAQTTPAIPAENVSPVTDQGEDATDRESDAAGPGMNGADNADTGTDVGENAADEQQGGMQLERESDDGDAGGAAEGTGGGNMPVD